MSSKSKTDSKQTKSKTSAKTPAVKKETKERAVRKSANPRLQGIADSKCAEIEKRIFAYAGKQNGVPVRGSRLVIARNVAFPIGFVTSALGMNKADFPSKGEQEFPTLAQEGSDRNICMGDLLRVLQRAGLKTINLHGESLPRGVVLASEKFPRKESAK